VTPAAEALPYLYPAAVTEALPMVAAIDALESALAGGLDSAADPARSSVDGGTGQLLMMPSAAGGRLAVKLVTVAPDDPGRALPRVQGVLVLFDPATLAPLAVVDGAALTALRTPAVSALAARYLAPLDARRLVVFGSGPQAEAHVRALSAVRPIDSVVIVGRDPGRAAALVARCEERGLSVRTGSPDDVADADVVVCATTASEPLFDGRLIRDGALVIAVGSHEPTAREVDTGLVQRSRVVVEDRTTALREAGDLILAGARPEQLAELAAVVRVAVVPDSRPTVFKTVGMAWEDAVVAAAAYERWSARAEFDT
jgi:ornithine cyclodeaminase/alanine dehydrogenase-like protein (mu-crystallin family)